MFPKAISVRALVLPLFLLALASPLAADEPPEWLDRVLWNAEERTRRGAESLEAGDSDAAAGALESALKLAPEDGAARYNAGTARLESAPERARGLLEAAAAESGAVGAKAAYNLGNLQLQNDELEAAIESYKNALRRDPSFEDAKFNLELAQRRLREQQQNEDQQDQNQDQQDQNQDQQQNQDQENQDQQQNQDQQDQDQENQDQQDQDQQNQDQQNEEQGQDQENQDQENQDQQNQDQDQQNQDQQNQDQQNQDQQNQDQQNQEGQQDQENKEPQGQEESPLPQFQDLPDMSAEEAAAILEAIENLEREQRRQEAIEAAAAARRSGKKDW